MLRPRNFNKLIHKTYSCWRNSTTKFSCQFLQIQNGNECHSQCKIPFKYPQLFQRCQFSNGNEGCIPSHPVVNRNLNYSTIPWPETAPEKRFENLDFRVLVWGDDNKKKLLKLKLQKGKKSGQKVFEISFNNKNRFFDFTNILVPEDAYAFVRAMDKLIEELAAEDFEQKLLQIKDSQSPIEIINDDQQTTRIWNLRAVESPGLRHNFQLELVFFPDNDREMMQKQICLSLCAVNKITMKQKRFNLPLHALPWLREQMAELLAKHDGTEEIEKEAPAQIPQKFLQYIYEVNEWN